MIVPRDAEQDGRKSPVLVSPVAADGWKVAGVVIAASVYATLRYNVAKGVPWSEWPGYIANKFLAATALILLAWAALRKLSGKPGSSTFMRWGGAAAIAHVPLSLCLLTPAHFEKLFSAGKLSAAGQLSLLFAAAATALLEVGARRAHLWNSIANHRAMAALLGVSAAHTIVPSATTWFKPFDWPAYLPPLTLLSTLPAFTAIGWWIASELNASRALNFPRKILVASA